MPEVSERTESLGIENAFSVLSEVKALQAKGRNICNFCVGQPDFVTPKNICEAGKKAIDDGKTDYTLPEGLPELRKAVAEYESKMCGIEILPEWVTIANGGKPFIQYTILSCTDYGKGHEVLYPNPGYPIYESQIIAQGAKPVEYFLLEEKEYSFDLEEFKEKITDKTKLVFVNSPHNPTGGVLSKEDLKGIVDLANDHDFWIFSDEIYGRIVFDEKFTSMLSIPNARERTILCSGHSKTFAMTGWRLGYAINEKLAPYFSKWVNNTDSCAAHMNQWAGVEALRGSQDEPNKMVEVFKKRRDLIFEGLNKVRGFHTVKPKGAFYIFPNVTEACKMVEAKDSEHFRKMLLNEAGVAVLADIHFGKKNPSQGEHIRFSYASSSECIKEGLKRLNEFMEEKSK